MIHTHRALQDRWSLVMRFGLQEGASWVGMSGRMHTLEDTNACMSWPVRTLQQTWASSRAANSTGANAREPMSRISS